MKKRVKSRRTMLLTILLAVLAIIAIYTSLYGISLPKSFNLHKNFTIIVLPDTQNYVKTSEFSSILAKQAEWIVANREEMNIKFAIFEGDLTDDNSILQWQRVNESISVLDGQVDYSVVPGNHDHPLDKFNIFFPVSRFPDSGFFIDEGNNYHLLNDNLVIISLDFCPEKQQLDWADGISKKYGSRKAILVTHGYLNDNGDIKVHNCETEQIFDNLVLKNENIFLILSGHVHGEARRVDDIAGRKVFSLLADYQDFPNGGNGWLRLLEFSGSRVYVRTYSPYLNQYKSSDNSEFVLDLK